MKRVLAAFWVLLFGAAALAAVPTPAAAAQTCAGVWVIVDYGKLGGTTVSCAPSGYGTGTAALRSAGFSLVLDSGMLKKINGLPASPDTAKEYWSYWHATKNANGSWGSWQYSNLGSNSYQPSPGNAEGWRYQALADGNVSPGSKPPVTAVTPPSATQTKTTAPAAPTTTVAGSTSVSSGTKSGTTSVTSGTEASSPTSGVSSAEPVAAVASSAESTATPSTGPTETPTAASSATDTATVVDGGFQGAPTGTIVGVGLVVVAGVGMGSWWWLIGRKR